MKKELLNRSETIGSTNSQQKRQKRRENTSSILSLWTNKMTPTDEKMG
jgi:hypothetical protein